MNRRLMKAVKINGEFFCYGDNVKVTHNISFEGIEIKGANIIKESIGELREIEHGYSEDSIVLYTKLGIENIGISQVRDIERIKYE